MRKVEPIKKAKDGRQSAHRPRMDAPAADLCADVPTVKPLIADSGLLDKAKYYRLISELVADFIYCADINLSGECTSVWATSHAPQFIGYVLDKLFLEPGRWLDLVHPDDRAQVRAFRQDLIQSKRLGTLEYRVLDLQGGVHWVSDLVQPIWSDGAGRVVQLVGAVEEITERRQTEMSLQEMSAALSHAVEGISRLDKQGTYIFVNEAYAHTVGYEPDEMIGMSWEKTVYPEDLASVETAYQHLQSVGKVELEARGIRKDGSIFDKQLVMIAAHDEQQRFTGHHCFMKDISEKKRLEAQRLQADQKIQEQAALLEITSDAIFVRDLEHRILYWNQGAERLYGWSAQEAVGQVVNHLLRNDTSQVDESIMQVLFEQDQWQGELHKVTKAGKDVIVEAHWTLVRDEAGQPKFILVVDTDVTDKKHLEAQFYRAQRLESLGTLASGIAHDLNNVLTPILTISQLMKRTQPNLDAQSLEMLNVLEDSAKRGANMVKQILTFTRGTDGKQILLDVAPLLQDVINVMQQTFPKAIAIREIIPDAFLGVVAADPTHLHQVFLNLCVNARDAMPQGGVLMLTLEQCCIDQSFAQKNLDARVGDYLLVTISDTGIGIPLEYRDRIFDPFFTTKPYGQGTGLGLSSVLGIVKTYGGFVQVSSEVGQGSQFRVYLPVTEDLRHETTQKLEQAQGNGELILIVDDDPAVQRASQSLLENHHYTTLVASDGMEAISLYAKHMQQVKVVLIDVMMPNLDGVTTVRTLKKMNPQLNVIAMSGLSIHKESTLTAGADIFLEKPYTVEELLGRLAELSVPST
jgi:PAS domain S-box-containing protein